jgi:glycosyltransferase involved in cell wall biosynthesis
MRIAQVSPLYESVPPKLYGGTERVVSWLTEELVQMGHEVTLFASGDSRTSGRLISPCDEALRLGGAREPMAPHILMLEQVFQRASEFDLIHFHLDFHHFPLTRRAGVTSVTTVHSRLDLPEIASLYAEFMEMPLVSISDAQRRPLQFANWAGTVHHGLPAALLRFSPVAQPYLAFVGRVAREKGLDRAIRIARAAGLELRVGAKISDVDRDYFEHEIRPLLALPGVRFIGEVDDRDKQELIGNALALLFPIDWPEPFGLVMIESMACGTPVIATRCGSVPEVVEHGRSGYIVGSIEEGVGAVRAAGNLSRRGVRACFDARFTSRRMAEDYLRIYEQRLWQAGGRIAGGAGVIHGRSRFD